MIRLLKCELFDDLVGCIFCLTIAFESLVYWLKESRRTSNATDIGDGQIPNQTSMSNNILLAQSFESFTQISDQIADLLCCKSQLFLVKISNPDVLPCNFFSL